MNMKYFIWCKSTSMRILKLMFFLTTRQNVTWIGVSGLTLLFMPCACKGYKPTSKIKTFDYNVKQKVINDEKR